MATSKAISSSASSNGTRFEIRVAVIGYVSVGKTTVSVIDSLLRRANRNAGPCLACCVDSSLAHEYMEQSAERMEIHHSARVSSIGPRKWS